MPNRYNKAGHPTTKPIAECIETLRDLLFREYGDNFSFSVVAGSHVIAYRNSTLNANIHAVIKE